MGTLMVHILVYIHAASVPQTGLYFIVVFSRCYPLKPGGPGLIICTGSGPPLDDNLLNLLNYIIYLMYINCLQPVQEVAACPSHRLIHPPHGQAFPV